MNTLDLVSGISITTRCNRAAAGAKSPVYMEASRRMINGVPLYDMDRASNGRYLAAHEELFSQLPLPASAVYPTHNGSHPKYDIKLDEFEEKARQIFNIDPTKLDSNSLPDSKLLQYLGYIEVEAEKLLRNWPSSKLN
jgi:hypothetical protein